MNDSVLIVGGGQAGAQAALSLRQGGFAGALTILGDEPYVPYERPPLSKSFLAGDVTEERMFMRPEAFYAEKTITLRRGRAVSIARGQHRLHLENGEHLAYGTLILATGGRVRHLNCPGADLAGVHYLRTIDDVLGFKNRLQAGARVVIVGGGYIGLETAAVAVKRGCKVIVLEMQPRVLARVVAPEMSAFYTRVHREAGVDVRIGAVVTGFGGTGKVEHVICGDEIIPADVVIVGIGIVPNAELADDAGLDVDDGIVVDENARTSDRDIFAAGDCTRQFNTIAGESIRLESVPNALAQGKAAALTILGKPVPPVEVPWFWSDQYDLKLQMAGLAKPGDAVVIRGDEATRRFSACYLRDGVFVACHAVNMAKDFLQSKKLIADRARPDLARLGDPALALKDL